MALTLLSNPDKVLHAIASNVNAAITQLPYTFKREDFTIGSLNDIGGLLRINLSSGSGDVTAQFAVGDTIFVDPVSYAPFLATVTIVDFSTSTRLQTSSDFVQAGGTGDYINLISGRSDYSVQLKIEKTDTSEILETVYVYKPSQKGELFIDIGSIIVTLMENDVVTYLNFRIVYRENYSGIDLSFTNDVIMMAVLGERGIGQELGSNLWVNLLKLRGQFQKTSAQQSLDLGDVEIVVEEQFDGTDATGVDLTGLFEVGQRVSLTGFGVEPAYNGSWIVQSKRFAVNFTQFVIQGAVYTINDGVGGKSLFYDRGNFLTKFSKLRFWEGWDVSITFIIDEDYDTRNAAGVTIRERARDINNQQVGASVDTVIGTSTARLRGYAISGEGLEANTPTIALFAFNTASETIAQIDVARTEECKNPIMVRWVNSLGATEFFLFDISQQIRFGVTGELRYQPAVDQDVAEITRQTVQINSDQTLRIICIAENLTQDDIRALHEIKTSENVEVHLTQDGVETIGVIVTSALETAYATDDNTGTFSVALDFPEDYDFFAIKQY